MKIYTRVLKVILSVFTVLFGLLFLATLARADDTGKYVLYYGEGCPHCGEVDAFIAEYRLEEELGIEIKEIYNNPENAAAFVEACEEVGQDILKTGVPSLFAEGKCYTGSDKIIGFLTEKIGSNPGNAGGSVNGSMNEATSVNSGINNWQVILIIAAVAVLSSAGILAFNLIQSKRN